MIGCRVFFFRTCFTCSIASLLTFFFRFFVLFNYCCSDARVFAKRLVHEFLVTHCHTEWYLLFLSLVQGKINLLNGHYYRHCSWIDRFNPFNKNYVAAGTEEHWSSTWSRLKSIWTEATICMASEFLKFWIHNISKIGLYYLQFIPSVGLGSPDWRSS